MKPSDYIVPPWGRRDAFVQLYGCQPEQYEEAMRQIRAKLGGK